MKYKVIHGSHGHAKKVYERGEVFESFDPLETMFPGKFEIVGAGAPVAVPAETMPNTPSRQLKPRQQAVEVAKPAVESPNQPSLSSGPEGQDVTKRFPRAAEESYRVYHLDDGTYNIYDDEDLSRPVNAAPVAKAQVNAVIKTALVGAK